MWVVVAAYVVEVLLIVTVLHLLGKYWAHAAVLCAPWFFYQMHRRMSKQLLMCSDCHFSKHQCRYAKPGAVCHFTPVSKLTVIQVASLRPLPDGLLKKV